MFPIWLLSSYEIGNELLLKYKQEEKISHANHCQYFITFSKEKTHRETCISLKFTHVFIFFEMTNKIIVLL